MILISGSVGQLGKAFIKILSAKKEEFTAFDIDTLDITDLSAVQKKIAQIKPQIIINCAAFTDVDACEGSRGKAYLVNGLGARNLAFAASFAGASIVQISTDYVFSGKKQMPYTVLDNPAPISVYGESKLFGEIYAKQFSPRYYIVRTSWLFGDSPNNFVAKFLNWIKEKDSIKVPQNRFSAPTYTYDLAKAVLDLVKTGIFGLYHITNQGGCSRLEFARQIAEIIGWKGEVIGVDEEEFNLKAKRPPFAVLDNFPLKETIGYTLRPYQEALREFLSKK